MTNFCSKCGNELKQNDNFCSKCGTKIPNNNSKKKNAVANIMIYVVGLVFFVILVMMFVLKDSKPVTTANNNVMQDPRLREQHQDVQSFIQSLKTKISQEPNDMEVVITLANFLHDEGMTEEAIVYYKKYLEKNTKNTDVIVDLGICYFELGDTKVAISEMEKAIAIDPKHQKAYFNVGIISLKERDFKKAIEYFDKCYKVNPNDPTGIQAKQILDQHKNRKN
jgi:tetratricopeptide (TPR) repeat protein